MYVCVREEEGEIERYVESVYESDFVCLCVSVCMFSRVAVYICFAYPD